MAKKSLVDDIKAKFDKLPPNKKRTAVIAMVVGAIVVVGGMGYNVSRGGQGTTAQNKRAVSEGLKAISVEPELIKKTMYSDNQNQLRELREELEKLKDEKELMVGAGSGPGAMTGGAMPTGVDDPFYIPSFDDLDNSMAEDSEKTVKEAVEPKSAPKGNTPAIPARHQSNIPPMPGSYGAPSGPNGQPMTQPIIVGEIVISKNPDAAKEIADAKKAQKVVDKKKEQEVIYLPTSFMEASLLSGIHAPTSGDGANNPVPMLIRIAAPGVLPNKVKSNLKGCFVVAEGVGSLAKERVDVRLVSLSCISKKDQAVIDQPLSGFVVDTDGKVGLAGRVVSKMGAAIARTAIAGLFGGIGDALAESASTESISALGSTSSLNTDEIQNAAIGEGLSNAADEIQKFYLELAKNSVPVIEVGATKGITLVVSQGVELQIKNFNRIGE